MTHDDSASGLPDRPLTPVLDRVHVPSDMKGLTDRELHQLADELRAETISAVSVTGGHLGAGLGVVELTVALHAVFDTPRDKIIWDVGHQCYPHKILTGRRDRIRTLRTENGLSGFTKRSESPFDPFGAGHSSTSISAALGFAMARELGGDPGDAIAVIGDGAMSAGMAFEALNNAGHLGKRLFVVLNDNEMSIAPPVGALSSYLTRLYAEGPFQDLKAVAKGAVGFLPSPLQEGARRAKEMLKGMTVGGTLFEELGFSYVGPVDGHDMDQLLALLRTVKARATGPVLIHAVTKKGKGYAPAERAADKGHATAKFDLVTGTQAKAKSNAPSYTSVFGRTLTDLAARDDKIVAITAAMPDGTGLNLFAERFPRRCFDVGIAEQHAVTFAAGMACEGVKPVVAIYSTFLQRGYDQLIHDVALQNLPVVFALDRAGLVGADGATHAGAYDIPFVRCIPNMSMACPADERECRQLLSTAFEQDHPVAVRYPRGSGAGVAPLASLEGLPFGKGEIRRERLATDDLAAPRVAILAFGTLLYPALQAAESLNATVVNMRWAKPLDVDLLLQVASQHDALVTVEEGAIMGGAGSAVTEALNVAGITLPVLQLGLPDVFIEHGDPAKLLALQGLDANGIKQAIAKRFFTTAEG